MVTRDMQADGEMDNDARSVMVLGQPRWSLGPLLPIVRALGVGFALGLLVSGAVALFVR